MAGRAANKVAEVTLAFWILNICATTLGETAGDLLSMTLSLGYTASSALLLTRFAATLAAQLRSPTFSPVLYWSVILSTSTAGTTMSDFLDRSAGLGYAPGARLLLVLLLAVLGVWRATEGSLAVSDVSRFASRPSTGPRSSSRTPWEPPWATTWRTTAGSGSWAARR